MLKPEQVEVEIRLAIEEAEEGIEESSLDAPVKLCREKNAPSVGCGTRLTV